MKLLKKQKLEIIFQQILMKKSNLYKEKFLHLTCVFLNQYCIVDSCYYLLSFFYLDNILIDDKSYENPLVYNI